MVSCISKCWWLLKLSWITCRRSVASREVGGVNNSCGKKKTSKWHGIGIEIGDTQFQAIKLTLEPSRSACSAPTCGLCQKCQNSVRKSAQNLSIANLVSILMVSFSNPVLHFTRYPETTGYKQIHFPVTYQRCWVSPRDGLFTTHFDWWSVFAQLRSPCLAVYLGQSNQQNSGSKKTIGIQSMPIWIHNQTSSGSSQEPLLTW